MGSACCQLASETVQAGERMMAMEMDGWEGCETAGLVMAECVWMLVELTPGRALTTISQNPRVVRSTLLPQPDAQIPLSITWALRIQ